MPYKLSLDTETNFRFDLISIHKLAIFQLFDGRHVNPALVQTSLLNLNKSHISVKFHPY